LSYFILASGIVGARLLLLYRRLKQPPELFLGLAYLLAGTLGWAVLLVGTLTTPPGQQVSERYQAFSVVMGERCGRRGGEAEPSDGVVRSARRPLVSAAVARVLSAGALPAHVVEQWLECCAKQLEQLRTSERMKVSNTVEVVFARMGLRR
jgi:hypothetical protein